jgi:starch phosphorylase
MKVLVNGGINVSTLDGWWDEAYTPEVGWALDGGKNDTRDLDRYTSDAEQLYHLLEKEIVPQFYTRNENGIPLAWSKRMRESMAKLTPRFSANRSVRQYTEEYYLPAADAYKHRAAKKGELAIQLVNRKNTFEKKWKELGFGEMTAESRNDSDCFNVQVYLHDIVPNELRVELYAEAGEGNQPEKHEMNYQTNLLNDTSFAMYSVTLPSGRAASDYTPRITPKIESASLPLECNYILWQQ